MPAMMIDFHLSNERPEPAEVKEAMRLVLSCARASTLRPRGRQILGKH